MSDTPAISVSQLSKEYRDGVLFKRQFTALSGVSFEVKRGEIFGLLGPNGAGKTTFLKILLGIIRKSSGVAQMMGFPAGSRAGRQLVGYLPEHLRIPAHMTGYTALECYGNLSNVSTAEIRKKRGPLLDLVGLGERGADRVKKYSKGMLQRLGLAQALLHEPKLLVLDEPTDGLDPRARAEVRAIIRDLKERGVTVFLNSHILQEVELVCDRVAVLHRGQLQYCGSVRDIGEFVNQLVGGSAKQTNVQLQLAGERPAIDEVFHGRKAEVQSYENGDGVSVSLGVDSQAELDLLIDQLRSRQISLLELQREQISLEEAFLKLVDEAQSAPPTESSVENGER